MFTLVQFGPLDHHCGTTYDVVFDEQDEPYTLIQFVEEAQAVHNYDITEIEIQIKGTNYKEGFALYKSHPEYNKEPYATLHHSRVVRAGAYQICDVMTFGVIIEEPR